MSWDRAMPGNTKPRKTSSKTLRNERVSQFTTPVDDETFAFIQAIERFKADRNRAFPSWSDVLSVIKGLGYEKREPPARAR
jgi:hypothetical protein